MTTNQEWDFLSWKTAGMEEESLVIRKDQRKNTSAEKVHQLLMMQRHLSVRGSVRQVTNSPGKGDLIGLVEKATLK